MKYLRIMPKEGIFGEMNRHQRRHAAKINRQNNPTKG